MVAIVPSVDHNGSRPNDNCNYNKTSGPTVTCNSNSEQDSANQKDCMPKPIRKTSRKQWSVQGEPRSLLKRLRSQLAEDGCAESQYLMAKALLEHTEDANYEENCQQAIFWLTQGSLQGCLEATNLLKECLEKGIGICEQNYHDVKVCLEMDHQKKLALVAGKQLFSSLSEGNEFITQKKLEAKVYEVICDAKNESVSKCEEDRIHNMSKREMEIYLDEKYGSARLSENSLVEAALEFVKGNVPSIPIKKDFETRTRISDAHFYFLGFIEQFVFQICNILNCLWLPLALTLFCLCILLFYSISRNQLTIIALAAIWLICFFTMCYSAVSIMVFHRNKKVFNIWGRVFKHFSEELDLSLAAEKYKKKVFGFYLAYFLCMLVYLVLLPIAGEGLTSFVIPPFIIVSVCLFASLFQSNFLFNCVSSSLYVFAHLSVGQKALKDWLHHNVPVSRFYVLEETFSFFNNVMHINIDIGSIFHSLWFVSLAFVSFTVGMSNILNHVLCLTWYHLSFLAFGEHFGALTYSSIILWSALLSIQKVIRLLTILAPSFLFALCCFLDDYSPWFALSVFVSLSCFLFVLSRLNSKLSQVVKSVMFILSMVFLFHQNSETSSRISPLKWEQFRNVCLPTKETVEIQAVRSCHPLRGTVVQWQASVKHIEIESISNLPEQISSFFPVIMQRHVKCYFGDPPSTCKRELFNSDFDQQLCLLHKAAKGEECSLTRYIDYKFRLTVSMDSAFWKFSKSSDVFLRAGNEFKEAAFQLSDHDRISFIGILDDGLGTSNPVIALTSLNCIDCKVKNLSASVSQRIDINYDILFKSIRSTFNFLFGPTFTV